MKNVFAVATIAALLAIASTASATVTLQAGNIPQQPDEQNVLFGAQETGNLVTGHLNQDTSTIVNFTSTGTLTDPPNGQARVQGSPESGGISNLTISMADPNLGYECLIFNIKSGDHSLSGTAATLATVTVNAVDAQGNPEVFTFTNVALDTNGQNFYTQTTADGEVMVSTTITTANGTVFHDLQQPRLCPAPIPSSSPQVPEPASLAVWTLLMSGLGLVTWRRRR